MVSDFPGLIPTLFFIRGSWFTCTDPAGKGVCGVLAVDLCTDFCFLFFLFFFLNHDNKVAVGRNNTTPLDSTYKFPSDSTLEHSLDRYVPTEYIIHENRREKNSVSNLS